MDSYETRRQPSDHPMALGDTPHGSPLECVERRKSLESSVFNHVSLGQWEAARACLACLATDPTSRGNARDLLKILVLEAASYWSESPAIPSPHHLSWLALETYKSLFSDDEKQLPGYVQDLVEFRLLLFAAKGLPSFSTRVASELCSYHSVHILKIPGSAPDTVPQLQPLIIQFLHDVITALNPALGHALISSLMVPSGAPYLANNEALQMIYIDCISETLESLSQAKKATANEHDSSYDSQYESDHPSSKTQEGLFKECEKKVSFIYTLLSFIDPSNEMSRMNNKLSRIFHTLLKTSFTVGTGLSVKFESGHIYACLLGRSSPLLIDRLYEVEDYLRMNRGVEDVFVTGESTPRHKGREAGSIQLEWKERFYQALLDHKHLLENVIDNGLQLVFTGQLSNLSQQMMQPEYVPLRPVLLLLGWDRYSAMGSGRELLDSLWPMEVSMKQSLLFDGCCKLAFQVELVQWCLEKARPHVQVPTKLTINRAGDMFKGLETHSTLYVLHHSTPLASLDPMEVIHILKMRPKVPSLSGGSGSVTPPPQFSREATPMKRLSESDTSPVPSPMFGSGIGQKSFQTVSHSTLKPEQERDIAIFRSFCAMRLVMDAIWNSVQLANNTHPSLVVSASASSSKPTSSTHLKDAPGRAERKASSKAVRKLELGDDSSFTSQQPEGGSDNAKESGTTGKNGGSSEPLKSKLYRNLVFDKLHEAKVYVSLIHPLNYRLEVLENMFSLLFLTSDELKQAVVGEAVEGPPAPSPGGGVAPLNKMDSFSSPGNGADGVATAAITSFALIKSQHTFLMDEDVTSDLLEMLMDCMFELRTDKVVRTQHKETSSSGKRDPSDLSPTIAVKSSVPHTSLHPRSSKLEQFITEARWRLKLVSSKYGITAGGGISPAVVAKFRSQSVAYDVFSSSDESVFEMSESEEEEKKEKKESRKRVRKTPSSDMREKDIVTSLTTLTPDVLSDGKSPTVSLERVSPFPSSQLSSPAPRPHSITPKHRRSVSPSPKTKQQGHGSKLKVAKVVSRGSRHTSPSSSAQTQSSSGAKNLPPVRKLLDDSGDYAADVEEKSPNISVSRKKRLRSRSSQSNLRKRRQRKSESSESSGFSKNNVVCKMLASPGSLLRMCLKHGNYNKAKEVVKMFKMEGQFGEAFVTFSEDFEQVSSDLSRRLQSRVRGSHSTTLSTSLSLSSSMTRTPTKGKQLEESTGRNFSSDGATSSAFEHTSLQEAILNATSNSGPLDSLHRLLAPSSISKMLFSGDEQLEKVAAESAVLRTLSDHVQPLIMLDLVCSGRVDGYVAKRIIQEAVSRSQDVFQSLHSRGSSLRRVKSHSSAGTPEGTLGGPFFLLHTLYELVGQFALPGGSQPQQSVVQPPYGSPHSLLTSLRHHLDVSTLTHSKSFDDLVRSSREKLEYVIDQKRSMLSSSTSEILVELSQGKVNKDETSSSSQKQSGAMIFDEVIRALNGTPDFISSSPWSSSSSGKDRCLMRHLSSSQRLGSLEDAPGHHGVRFSYVRQFSRYLVKLVDLLVNCLGVSRAEASKDMLLISVLREGPSQLLGWLVFEQGILPQRLEAMMGDFPQLRIVDVLVKCCCPTLPSNTAVSRQDLQLTSPRAVMALNDMETTASPDDPCDLSYNLLNKLVSILKKSSVSVLSQGGVVTPDDLVQMYNSAEVQKILKKTALFTSVNLNKLDSLNKKKVFYSNVANLLYSHALMIYFVNVQPHEKDDRHHGIIEGTFPSIQTSRILQLTYFTKVGYHIGQLGLVSCFDLHHTILRQGLTTPTLVKGAPFKARLKPIKPDPWSLYAPPMPDPRLLYVIHDGRISSPAPAALTVTNFEATIKSAEQAYINSTVVIYGGTKELHLPQWLYENRYHLGELIWEEGSVPSDSTPFGHLSDVSFLNYIQTHLEKDKADWLKPYADVTDPSKSKKISFVPQPDSLKLGYNFGSKPTTSSKASPRSSPKMKRRGLSREISRRELSLLPTFQEEPSRNTLHSFTPETLAFIKQRTPLVSAVVHLICPVQSSCKTGKGGGFEEDSVRKDPNDDDQELSTKRSFIQSLMSKPARTGGSPTHRRATSVDEQQRARLDPWKKQYEEVLSHFEVFPPMKRYLTFRLSCFEAMIMWDLPHPHKSSVDTGKKSPSELVDGREFPVSLRRLAALSSVSDEVGAACSYVMKRLVEEGRIVEAVKFLSSEPATSNSSQVRFLKDIIISCLFVNSYSEILSLGQSGEDAKLKMETHNPVALLSQLSDSELAARLTLSSLHNWPVDVCVDLLSYCYHHTSSSSSLEKIVEEKLKRMRVYSQIMAICKSPLRGYESKTAWKCWSDLAKDTESKPEYVMEILLTTKQFDLIRHWVQLHELEAKFSQQIEVEYLFDLLEGHNSDPITAHQVLDGISDDKMTLKVCEALLTRTDLQTSLFVLHYMLTRLSHNISLRRSHYSNRLMGAKALLCLPTEEQKKYEPFILHPLLLVEELLIDSKIEWAGQVIEQLRANEYLSDISLTDTPILERRLALPIGMGDDGDDDPFSTLLMFYCDKALEFPHSVIVQSTPAETAAPSVNPTSPPSPVPGETGPAPSVGVSQKLASTSGGIPIPGAMPTSPTTRGGTFDLYDQYPSMTPRHPVFVPKKRTLSNATNTLPCLQESDSEVEGDFKPPPQPPTKLQWDSDNSTRICRVCKQVSFNMFVRRHHCRRCGRVVCAGCSNRTAFVEGYNQHVRVCDKCFPYCSSELQLPSDDNIPYMATLDGNADLDVTFPPLSPTHLHHWKLIPDDPHYNQTVRKAFYYERTPNTTLFLSLLDLIANKKHAAAFILDCCRTVSMQLMPDTTDSDEIDHNFVIELIENLLMNAKLRFANSGDSAGVELCDTYLSRVELLHLLVTSQCSKIPSLQELTNPDLARRVRDRLIQDDRFSLAMEVSTKCQLDASAVWSAWGMMALKSGDFKTAREKFIRCFQVSSQSKLASSGGQNLQLLHRIVDQIEQYPLSVSGRQTQYSDDWSSVLSGSMALTNRTSSECDLDLFRFNECVYYLRTYGNHSTLLSFYVRQGCWFDAARYILENRCPNDLFVDYFWVPALKTGQIAEVEGHLKALDPSLESWHGYLTAACRYFTQKGLFSVLYHTQLLMNDLIRAGMTCIKFFVGFSGRSTTVSELDSRLFHLEEARRHFQAALEAKSRPLERAWGSRSSGRSNMEGHRKAATGTKTMSVDELEKHLATIDLQVKVTRFISHNAEPGALLTTSPLSHGGGGGAEASLSSPGGWSKQGGTAPPTLFGNGHARAEVAVLVLTMCQDIIEGNSLAREIMQIYKLPMTNVYCAVARVLASKQLYSDIRLLLQCIEKTSQGRSHTVETLCDEIIMAAIKVLSNQAKEAKQVDKLVQLLTNERSKIKAYIQCGKLKNAYLIAIKSKLVDEVRNISDIAGKAGQLAVKDICDKWLAQKR